MTYYIYIYTYIHIYIYIHTYIYIYTHIKYFLGAGAAIGSATGAALLVLRAVPKPPGLDAGRPPRLEIIVVRFEGRVDGSVGRATWRSEVG